MKSFLNYFTSKIISLNIVQNYLFKYFVSLLYGILSKWYIIIQQKKSNFRVLFNFTNHSLTWELNQIVKKCLNASLSCLSIWYFHLQIFWKSLTKLSQKLWQCQMIYYLLVDSKTVVILRSFHSICFVKTSTRIVKYEQRVVKSNFAMKRHEWIWYQVPQFLS